MFFLKKKQKTSNEEEIHEIVLSELQKGTKPEQIVQFAYEWGIATEIVHKSLRDIFHNQKYRDESFYPALSLYLSQGSAAKGSVWKILADFEEASSLQEKQQKVRDKFQKWKQKPQSLKLIFFSLASIPFVFAFLFLSVDSFSAFITQVFFEGENNDSGGFLGLLLAPPLAYWFYVRNAQIDMVKMAVCEKFGWEYDPSESNEKWEKAKEFFAEIFNKGNQNQNIQDQIQGRYKGEDFCAGVFHYEVVSGSGKNRKVRRYDRHYFGVKLKEDLSSTLFLKPEDGLSKIKNKVLKNDIETESFQFNKYFQVLYDGPKAENELELVSMLSPSVQTRLVDMYDQAGKYTVLCKGDLALFVFEGRMFDKMHTNFIMHGVELDPKDQQYLEQKMTKMLDLLNDLVDFIK